MTISAGQLDLTSHLEAGGTATRQLRVAAAALGNGLTGGGASTLSVDVDSETGANIQPANLTANGVGVDINAIAGTGMEADGSANLRLAAQGTGIAGGAGSTLSFDATAADGNGLTGSGAVLTVDADSETGGNIQPINLTANGVGVDINAIVGTGIAADGSANLQIDTGSTVSFSGESWTHSNGGLLVSGSTFSTTQVPNADWVLSLLAAGVAWKFPVLHDDQLDSSGDAVRQAIPFFLDNNAFATDTFRVSDGTTTETWTAVAGVAGANQFSIDTNVDTCMASLATRISADSTLWDAVVATGLNSINDGSGTSTAGTVIIIYRTVQAASKSDRIFSNGVNNTQANWVYVDFTGADDYKDATNTELPSADPAAKEFGPGTITASLVAGEAHVVLNGDSQYVWDADGASWTQISGTGSITAGAGLTKSGNTININAGTGTANGIAVNADAIAVALEAAASGAGGLALDNNEIRISLDGTGGANIASVLELNSNGLAISVDDSTVEESGAGGQLRVKALGIDTSHLAADAVEVDKLGFAWVVVDIPAASFAFSATRSTFTLVSGSALADAAVNNSYILQKNGVDELTKISTTTATDEWSLSGTSLAVHDDVTASADTYRLRYMIAHP